MSATRLGRVQMKIMQVLWEKGRISAREITETLNQEKRTDRPQHRANLAPQAGNQGCYPARCPGANFCFLSDRERRQSKTGGNPRSDGAGIRRIGG